MTVRQRAEMLATLRSIEITLMETLARWIPTTPMMEVKVLFGRHIWEVAQHADILGKRTFELRAPLHFTLAPHPDYAALLEDAGSISSQAQRISALYDVLLPAVAARCRAYLAETDEMLDEPSVRVLRRILADGETMIAEANGLRSEHPELSLVDAGWRESLSAQERSVATIVAQTRGGEVAHA